MNHKMKTKLCNAPSRLDKNTDHFKCFTFFVLNPGLKNILPANGQEIDFFQLIFLDELYEHLVQETNLHAQQKMP